MEKVVLIVSGGIIKDIYGPKDIPFDFQVWDFDSESDLGDFQEREMQQLINDSFLSSIDFSVIEDEFMLKKIQSETGIIFDNEGYDILINCIKAKDENQLNQELKNFRQMKKSKKIEPGQIRKLLAIIVDDFKRRETRRTSK